MDKVTELATNPILLHQAYASELRVHAITLIVLGYQRLSANTLVTADEDDITGELVRCIKLIVTDSKSPVWVDHYEVREQIPQNTNGVFGKRRARMDIEVERDHRGPRPCLGFEAKRLGRGCGFSEYVGDEGLGSFLSGHYSTTHGEAGMLGYIQEKHSDHWRDGLIDRLKAGQHRISIGGDFKVLADVHGIPHYSSGHTTTAGSPIVILHVLLMFAPPSSQI
jgi:hypothetical protein